MIITYRNPKDVSDTIDVHFDIPKNDFTQRWTEELKLPFRKKLLLYGVCRFT